MIQFDREISGLLTRIKVTEKRMNELDEIVDVHEQDPTKPDLTISQAYELATINFEFGEAHRLLDTFGRLSSDNKKIPDFYRDLALKQFAQLAAQFPNNEIVGEAFRTICEYYSVNDDNQGGLMQTETGKRREEQEETSGFFSGLTKIFYDSGPRNDEGIQVERTVYNIIEEHSELHSRLVPARKQADLDLVRRQHDFASALVKAVTRAIYMANLGVKEAERYSSSLPSTKKDHEGLIPQIYRVVSAMNTLEFEANQNNGHLSQDKLDRYHNLTATRGELEARIQNEVDPDFKAPTAVAESQEMRPIINSLQERLETLQTQRETAPSTQTEAYDDEIAEVEAMLLEQSEIGAGRSVHTFILTDAAVYGTPIDLGDAYFRLALLESLTGKGLLPDLDEYAGGISRRLDFERGWKALTNDFPELVNLDEIGPEKFYLNFRDVPYAELKKGARLLCQRAFAGTKGLTEADFENAEGVRRAARKFLGMVESAAYGAQRRLGR